MNKYNLKKSKIQTLDNQRDKIGHLNNRAISASSLSSAGRTDIITSWHGGN